MTTIAFLGLGNMGGPMAANLVKAGHTVRGFDLSPEAIETAESNGIETFPAAIEAVSGSEVVITMLPNGGIVKKVYDEVEAGDLVPWLEAWPEGAADLVLAADVFVYLADLAPVFATAAVVLDREGLFAFTVQAHAGEGAVLGDDQRFAHSERHLLALAQRFSFEPVIAESASTRQDRGEDVPGLLMVLAREA